ncbi:MAG: ParA family protein [Aeromonadales bacterium]|nr:ParA family protein [Aeromonadales bacterium]
MLVWAIASQKGGVGKTTTVASLAGWCQRENIRCLIIDTDPHASLTSYLGFDYNSIERNLYDLYIQKDLTKEKVLECITHTNFPNLDIIASSMTLATIDRKLSGQSGVGRILSRALDLIKEEYDVVIVDCPPVLGALMVNALVASTSILVPTQTEFLSLKGLEGMVRTFSIMKKADSECNINYTVIPTMYDKRTKASRTSLEFLKAHYKDNLWNAQIPIDTLFRESSQRGMPITMLDEKCRGAVAYYQLLVDVISKELINNVEKVTPNVAAIVSFEEKEKASKETQDVDIVADDMGSMLS